MRLLAAGDVHGKFHDLYRIGKEYRADAILCVGDLETVRTSDDLYHLPGPEKHRKLGDFPFYWEQQHVPIPTFFIGGNHEAFNLLEPFAHGGTIMRNLHYIGRTGVVHLDGLAIGGLSGIHSSHFFEQPRGPYEPGKQRTYYNNDDIEQLKSYGKLDILLLHDWPFRPKIAGPPHDRRITGKERDFPHIEELIQATQPGTVFCGHIHIPYECRIGNSTILCLNILGNPGDTYVIDT